MTRLHDFLDRFRPAGTPWKSPVLTAARQAHRTALVAAVRHATAAEALRVMEAEALATQIRPGRSTARLMPAQ